MPELAEVRLTSDYVNSKSEGIFFQEIRKNPNHKWRDVKLPFNIFWIKSSSRGKEMVLYLHDAFSDRKIPLRMTMGMGGHFQISKKGNEPKHAHLNFLGTGDEVLSFVDVRRFGKWHIGQEWSPERGPDPTTEFSDFVENINSSIRKKFFDRPIYVALMDQRYFNGIGNYLRAEILYRIPSLDPLRTSARIAIEENPKILDLCRDLPLIAYRLGGGQLKDWKNPFLMESKSFTDFILCYGNKKMSRIEDPNGRVFWYDPKWN